MDEINEKDNIIFHYIYSRFIIRFNLYSINNFSIWFFMSWRNFTWWIIFWRR